MRYRRVLFPSVLLVALLAAWPLRWERGPTMTIPGDPKFSFLGSSEEQRVVHLKDRWTGQAWITVYTPSSVDTGPLIEDDVPQYITVQSQKPRRGFGAVLLGPVESVSETIINPRWAPLHEEAAKVALTRRNTATAIWSVLLLTCFGWIITAYRRGE